MTQENTEITRTQDPSFPLTFADWDESFDCYGDIQFHDVIFTDDFGPIKKGEHFDCVVVYHSQGQLVAQQYDSEGDSKLLKEVVVKFKINAIE